MTDMNQDAAYALILRDTKNFKSLPEEFKRDKEFIKKCLTLANFPTNLQYIAKELKHDAQFVKEAVEIKYLALFYMGKEFHTQKEYILIAAEQDQYVFDVLDDSFNVYKNNLDQLREEVKIEKLKDKLESHLNPIVKTSKLFKSPKI